MNMLVDAALEIVDTSSSTFLVDSGMLLGGARAGASALLQNHPVYSPLMNLAKNAFNPNVEAEVLTDVSHVIMDFPGFFIPSKSLLKIYSVVGRILVLLADYLPDHCIHSEELLVQLVLLAVGVNDVVKLHKKGMGHRSS
jgi:hypothetical protein